MENGKNEEKPGDSPPRRVPVVQASACPRIYGRNSMSSSSPYEGYVFKAGDRVKIYCGAQRFLETATGIIHETAMYSSGLDDEVDFEVANVRLTSISSYLGDAVAPYEFRGMRQPETYEDVGIDYLVWCRVRDLALVETWADWCPMVKKLKRLSAPNPPAFMRRGKTAFKKWGAATARQLTVAMGKCAIRRQ